MRGDAARTCAVVVDFMKSPRQTATMSSEKVIAMPFRKPPPRRVPRLSGAGAADTARRWTPVAGGVEAILYCRLHKARFAARTFGGGGRCLKN